MFDNAFPFPGEDDGDDSEEASSRSRFVPSEPRVHPGRPEALVIEGFRRVVLRVLHLPPPGPRAVDPAWTDFFRYCGVHCRTLAARVRRAPSAAEMTQEDLWLRQLAATPYGRWGEARNALQPFIRLAGITPSPSIHFVCLFVSIATVSNIGQKFAALNAALRPLKRFWLPNVGHR